MMQRLVGWFGGSTINHELLLTQDEFTQVVRTERRRADRSGSCLTLVEFQLKPGTANSTRNDFCQALRDRLRETDAAGLLPKNQIGVVMPDTDGPGARTFVTAIQELNGLSDHLDVKIYAYPDTKPQPVAEEPADNQENTPESGEEQETLLAAPLPTWKRSLDMIIAPVALVAFLPILLVAAVAIKITSPGSVLFRQLRSGRDGKPFNVFKLRTMCLNAENQRNDLLVQNEQDGPAFKIEHDPRITPVGRFLRRTCIDELPQLWNVVKGEMTLVGPRPLPCHESAECQGWERRRLEVTPGLTGIWQVEGGTRVSFAEWMRMDIRYINSRRISGDLMLLWRTATKVVMQRASH